MTKAEILLFCSVIGTRGVANQRAIRAPSSSFPLLVAFFRGITAESVPAGVFRLVKQSGECVVYFAVFRICSFDEFSFFFFGSGWDEGWGEF
jgi:hypothetical protein